MTATNLPELPEPGAFASEPIDKLLLDWRTTPADPATETPARYFARTLLARSLDGARATGLDIRATVADMSALLADAAEALGSLKLDPDAFATQLAAMPDAEEPKR